MMERLPISKIQAILSLPEADREPMAERAAREDMSLRELQEAVKREKQRADQLAAEKANSIARATAAERELSNLKADIPKLAENLAAEYAEKATEEIDALPASSVKRPTASTLSVAARSGSWSPPPRCMPASWASPMPP